MFSTRVSFHRSLVCCAALASALSVSTASAQDITLPPANDKPQSSGPAAEENVPQLRERLGPPARQQLDDALAAFQAGRFPEALTLLNQLRDRHPRDPVLPKFVAEASLNTGDTAAALAALKPLAMAAPNDWQAAALLARACAESGDAVCRDAQIEHVAGLQAQGITPQGVRDYVVERTKVGPDTLTIFVSLVPYSAYKIYATGRLTNAEGKLTTTLTLESNDTDQPLFASTHPKEAAAGQRLFSIDAYAESGTNAAGQRTQTHYTFQFIQGRPTYSAMRDVFLAIASGKASPMTKRTGLIVP